MADTPFEGSYCKYESDRDLYYFFFLIPRNISYCAPYSLTEENLDMSQSIRCSEQCNAIAEAYT